MNNLIVSIEALFCNLFKDVADSFSGSYSSSNSELEEIKEDILNAPIPSINQDRVNLKNDRKNVVLDYKNALDLKKQED